MIAFADASTIIFAAPVFTSVFAKLILNEECGLAQVLNIAISVVGIVLIAKPSFLFQNLDSEFVPVNQTAGILLALFASLCFALTFVLMRKLKRTPAEVVIFWFTSSSAVLGISLIAVLQLTTDYSPGLPTTGTEIGLIFANGMMGVISQPLLTVALKIEEAGPISLARTIDVVMAFVYQALFLSEPVTTSSLLGAFIVSISVALTITRKWYKDDPETFVNWCCCCVRDKDREEEKECEEEKFEERQQRQDSVMSYSGLKEEFP